MAVQTAVTVTAGIVFGLALAAPPGPMNAIIAEESVLRGWGAGCKAGLGAMVADAIFFVLALLGVVAVVQRRPLLRAGMVTVGGVLMLYFAVSAARNVRATLSSGDATASTAQVADATPAASEESRGFRKALVLALTNPYQILFWLTVGIGLLTPGEVDILAEVPLVGDRLAGVLVVETGTAGLVVGLFGGIVVWITLFPAALVAAENRLDRLAPLVTAGSAAILAGFGVFFLWDGLTTVF